MSYHIQNARNINLEDTSLPNLFIEKIMPDVPDGDFLKVYIYAYMCCKQDLNMTHIDIADKLGIGIDKVIAAWRYFEKRSIVRLIQMEAEGDLNFDVEFIDIKGMLYVKGSGKAKKATKKASEKFDDIRLRTMFSNVATICNSPTFDGDDAQKVYKWITNYDATPDIIEEAYLYSQSTRENTNVDYVGKIVKTWSEKGLKTKNDVVEYLAATDEKHNFYKKLMASLGVKYLSITEKEKTIINTWLDDYGYTPNQLLEFAEKTAGVSGNRFNYLGGIVRNEREKKGEVQDSTPKKGSLADRKNRYRQRRDASEAQAEANREEVYGAVPAIKTIEDEIVHLSMEAMKVISTSRNNKEEVNARFRRKIKEKLSEKARLMEKAGFPEGYTDIKYVCEKCKDSGILDNGVSCDCLD